MSGPGVALLLAALAVVAGEAIAQAAPPARAEPASRPAWVLFRKSECAPLAVEEESFVRLLGIELKSEGVTEIRVVDAAGAAGERREVASLSLEGACAEDAVTVVIDDAATDKSVRRIVDFDGVPASARARVLSLATAELLRASWLELVLPDAPKPRTPLPAAAREAITRRVSIALAAVTPPPPRSTARAPWLLAAEADARYFTTDRIGMFGGRLLAEVGLGSSRLVSLRLDAGILHGTGEDPLGHIDIWLATGAASLTVSRSDAAYRVEIGPRIEMGWAHARGTSVDSSAQGQAGSALISTAGILASARLLAGAGLWPTVDAEMGYVLKGFRARAGAHTATGIGGAMGAIRIGVGVSF